MRLPAITFHEDELSHLGEVITKEWLVTNGLGGYSSSTIPGINTRKYHGLLVAALHPPGDRTVCLSKLDEDILVDNDFYRLGSNEFHDVIYPDGYKLIKQFTVDPFPTYIFDLGNVGISKTVFMPKNKNAVCLIYNVSNQIGSDVMVRLYPLLTCRYFHTVVDRTRTTLDFNQKGSNYELEASFKHPQATIICRTTAGKYRQGLNWVDHLLYRNEEMRGEADVDDCFQPGFFEVQVPPSSKEEFAITCAVSQESQATREVLDSLGKSIEDINELFNQEVNQRGDLLANFYHDHPAVSMSDWLDWILIAADSFIVKNAAGGKAIIAGYYWFEPWGRDTFISLPGLTLVTGRFDDAQDILQNFIQYCKGGLIPNFVSDKTGIPVYNTVDGTLWYVNAVQQYLKYTGDFKFVRDELWESLQAIVENHQKGTLFGIHLDDDGLLMHGSRLTWMDAAVDGGIITPRKGKAVEIQALWYNTLRIMERIATKLGENDLAKEYAAMANQTSKSFNEKFWNPQRDCLFDVLEINGGLDASIRPNQIFSVSLDFTMLDKDKTVKVVEVVNNELVTPYGLRTLALNDPQFIGKCFGDRRSRDAAYHNGTIWPWLLGPFVTAFLKVNSYSAKVRQQALENLVVPMFTSGIRQGGLGSINEIYDCDPPNEPRGCIAQAWSVAEPLRAYVEDVLGFKPKIF